MKNFAIDIGSTVVKVAHINATGELLTQNFFPRDFEAGIGRQLDSILESLGLHADGHDISVCSSANGGLRVGIVCLSKYYSGTSFRNQALLAGANPAFVYDMDEPGGDTRRVDILLVGGGIDCVEATPLLDRLMRFDPSAYKYDALVYAGNKYAAEIFCKRFPDAKVVANPLGETLSNRVGSVFEAIRRAYLDDLVHKEGISQLSGRLAHGVRPTPEVVSRGFLRAVQNKSTFDVVGACLVLDIGGATTDLHFTVEIVREDSSCQPTGGISVARYVFADLGTVASRDTLLLQLRTHPRLYELLSILFTDNVRDTYGMMREGEYEPSPELLAYACLFLALDRFSNGRGPGLPTADLGKIAQIILTGGAAQAMREETVTHVVKVLLAENGADPLVQIDRRYQLWVDGISWAADAPIGT